MSNGEKLRAYIKNNTGKMVGMILGLILGVLVLTLGIKRSIILVLFIGLGLWFGNKIDSGDGFHSLMSRFNRDYRNH